MDRVFILSPHYDDAALSCGQFIIGHHNATVVTVCSGTPNEDSELTEYDRNCGFRSTAEVLPARKSEESRALEVLGAGGIQLGLMDDQYGGEDPRIHVSRVAKFFGALNDRDSVLAPIATRHPDHIKVMDAALTAARRQKTSLYLYEELPHRVLWPEEVQESKASIMARHRVELSLKFIGDGDLELKRVAVSCYESQLWALDLNCVFVPERFYEVKFT